MWMNYKRVVYHLICEDSWYWQSTEIESQFIGFFSTKGEALAWARTNLATLS